MLSIYIFLILSSSICISSKYEWENFVDRLDFLIIESYLIVQCNEKEIQIVRTLKTFEELKFNMKCKNKENLFKHGIDRIQIVNQTHYTFNCENGKSVMIIDHIKRIKSSLDKDENGVDWPFLHTSYTEAAAKQSPIKMKFHNKDRMDLHLRRIDINELKNEKKKKNISIYLDFVNRPMICRLHLTDLEINAQVGFCNSMTNKEIWGPVHGQNPPSHEEFDEIIEKTDPYVEHNTDNYVYITNDIKHSTDKSVIISDIKHSTNKSKTPNFISKINKFENIESKMKNDEKKNPVMIKVIFIILLCLIGISIGVYFYYQKYSKEKNNKLIKKESSLSNESQLSIVSDSEKSQKDKLTFSLPSKQTTKRTTTNWFKFDEDL